MGATCSGCSGRRAGNHGMILLVIGLDNSGKTTLSQVLKGDMSPDTVPTVGFSAPVTLSVAGHAATLYDLGGGARIRGVWPSYFAEVHGVVYVVDAADRARLEESAQELSAALLHPMVVGKPVLIFANKQDLPQAMNEADISEAMGLERVATLCRHHVQAIHARPQAGVVDPRVMAGMRWLVEAVVADVGNLNARRKREMEEFAGAERLRRERQAAEYAAAKARREAANAAAGDAPPSKPAPAPADGEHSTANGKTAEAAASETGAAAPPATASEPAVDAAATAEPTSTPAPAATPAPAPAPAPAAAPAPNSNAIMCVVCKARPAVRRAGIIGWQAGCAECIAAAEEAKARALAIAAAAEPQGDQ